MADCKHGRLRATTSPVAMASSLRLVTQTWARRHRRRSNTGHKPRPSSQLLDTRSAIEFDGSEKHPTAARAGRIPGAVHLDWAEVLRDKDGDHRLRSPDALRQLFSGHGVGADTPVVTYCQSGTRSAAVYFALRQLDFNPDEMLNYDGSWAEYSRLDLPVEP